MNLPWARREAAPPPRETRERSLSFEGVRKHRSLLLIGPFLVALAAWYGISTVHRGAAERRRARTDIARLETIATRQDALESHLLQLGTVLEHQPEVTRATATGGTVDEIKRLRGEGTNLLQEIEALSGDRRTTFDLLQSEWSNYQEKMSTALDLLENGQFAYAYRYAKEALAPRFRSMEEQFDESSRSFARSAQAAEQRADAGTFVVLMTAAFLLFLMQRQRTRWAKEMAHRAHHDPLTDLANRALLWDRTSHALDRLDRRGGYHAIVLLDIDDFKSINDTLGHHFGDEVLVEVAARLQSALRAADTIARLGGDEFAVLIEDVVRDSDVTAAVRRLSETMSVPFVHESHTVFLSISAGITFCSAGDSVEQILGNADVAMYAAKFKEKGTHKIYEPAMRQAIVMRKDLESDLRTAMREQQFILQYQPIIDVGTSNIVGIEALVRWMHPTRGLVPPNDFIPVVEQTTLAGELGLWVLRTACRQLKEFREAFPTLAELRVGINVSAQQLMARSFIDDVKEILEEEALHPSYLVLEVTEGTLMSDTEAAIERLGQLRSNGVRLAIDDFGTGYSSLGYLRRFPLDIIKIDRSFIEGIERDEEGAALVKGIISMAEALRLGVVAEGIETVEQLQCLRRLGCTEGQGFYIARPLDPEVLELLLQKEALGQPLEEAFDPVS